MMIIDSFKELYRNLVGGIELLKEVYVCVLRAHSFGYNLGEIQLLKSFCS